MVQGRHGQDLPGRRLGNRLEPMHAADVDGFVQLLELLGDQRPVVGRTSYGDRDSVMEHGSDVARDFGS